MDSTLVAQLVNKVAFDCNVFPTLLMTHFSHGMMILGVNLH